MKVCQVDGKILSGAKSQYSHNKLHLNDEHQCQECNKTFGTLQYLMQHKKKIHTDALYSCNECDEKFKTKFNLKYNKFEDKHKSQKNRGKRFFYVTRDFYDANHTDRSKFKKKNSVRRRL